jgi:hypothetical protein
MFDETRFMLDNVFNYVPEESADGDAYWWQSTHSKDGWIVVWYDGEKLTTHHMYRYPPNVLGGLDRYPVELTGPARV